MMGVSMIATASFLALWAAIVFDVVRTDARFVRQGPKWCWMIFVLTLPVVGALAWMVFGRPFFMVRRDPVEASRPIGHEDTPEWAEFVAKWRIDPAERLD